MTEVAYRVRGVVQGVGFRWWTRSQALQLGLTGTVRNLTNGEVEVKASGPETAVAEFRRRLAQGPAGARVAGVRQIQTEPVTERGFEIIG